MKIHFACLFGVDYDMDLLPWWGPYYAAMRFDSYKIFLHREKGSISQSLQNEFQRFGFDVIPVTDCHQGNGLLRKEVLTAYAKSLSPDDYLVTADADEFQTLPESIFGIGRPIPIDYRLLFNHFDIVTGFLADRYTNGLSECCGDPFLQYPREEPFTKDILKNFAPPALNTVDWPSTRRTKILAARAKDHVSYTGSHCLLETPNNAKIAPGFKVVHFAWREATKRKVAVKSYFSREVMNVLFDGNVPPVIKEKYETIQPEMILTSEG